MLITATTGNENFPNCGCKVHLFAVPSVSARGHGKEVHIAFAAKDGLYGINRSGSMRVSPAAPQHIDEYGKWYRATFEVPDGVVLKMFVSRKLAEQVAGRHQTQAVYLRAREGAPLIRVTCRTTGSDIGAHNTVHTEGRFDILDADQIVRAGVNLQPAFRRTLEDSGLITIEQIAPGTETAPVVTEEVIASPDGDDVVIRRSRRGRALDL